MRSLFFRIATPAFLVFVSITVLAAGPQDGLETTVINESDNPVPVEGSVTIDGGVTIGGEISVVNTPGVTVENTPTVNVNSSDLNPVIVHDIAMSPQLVRGRLVYLGSSISQSAPPDLVITDLIVSTRYFGADPTCTLVLEPTGSIPGFDTALGFDLVEGLTQVNLTSGIETGVTGMDFRSIIGGSGCSFSVFYMGFES
jgi:hypothetical protein